jgi:hypothetical protein
MASHPLDVGADPAGVAGMPDADEGDVMLACSGNREISGCVARDCAEQIAGIKQHKRTKIRHNHRLTAANDLTRRELAEILGEPHHAVGIEAGEAALNEMLSDRMCRIRAGAGGLEQLGT